MLELTRIDVHGTGRDADTETLLTVEYGTILYSVRKLSANSRYEVHTPNGWPHPRNGLPSDRDGSPAGRFLCSLFPV